MGRVTVHIADSVLSALDEEAHNRNISRSQAVATSIESFITGVNQATIEAHNIKAELSANKEEVMRLSQEITKLTNQIAEKDKALESNSIEVMRLKGEVKRLNADLEQNITVANKLREEAEQCKNNVEHVNSEKAQLKLQFDQTQDELEHSNAEKVKLKDEIEQLKKRYDQSLLDATQRWEETKTLSGEISKLKKSLAELQAINQRLQKDLIEKQAEVDRTIDTMMELSATKAEKTKLLEALKVRDDDISWLRGHVAQLTQQLALPPSPEEAEAKHWWQFWRKG